ncbi:hypothetical protein Pmani_023560 [Petrolisthes manimaculis]|uniref:Uncharacterized protein n=1 Tax=Petrolisthes manimaculis TaxID=1843537 RepID=A0AAE1P9M4_9EUCA|nr:hypothetical protein Pmani_023560 [Petrolisthes manimaculis]
MRFGKGDKVYKELLVERRGITSSNQSDKMAARESTTAFTDDQLDELCETFNTVAYVSLGSESNEMPVISCLLMIP